MIIGNVHDFAGITVDKIVLVTMFKAHNFATIAEDDDGPAIVGVVKDFSASRGDDDVFVF